MRASGANPPVSTPAAAAPAPRAASASYGVSPIMTDLGCGEPKFSKGHANKAWIGFTVLDIVAACGHADELVNLQQGKIAFKLGSFAIRRQRNPPAVFDKRAEYVADTIKGPYPIKILIFVDCALRL